MRCVRRGGGHAAASALIGRRCRYGCGRVHRRQVVHVLRERNVADQATFYPGPLFAARDITDLLLCLFERAFDGRTGRFIYIDR